MLNTAFPRASVTLLDGDTVTCANVELHVASMVTGELARKGKVDAVIEADPATIITCGARVIETF